MGGRLFTPCCDTRDTSPYHGGNIKEYPVAPTFGQQSDRNQLSNAIFYGSTLHRKMQLQRRRRRRKKRIKRSER